MEKVRKYSKLTFSSLDIYNYKLFFVGQMLSLSGSWMQAVAQTLLMLQLTGSGLDLGLLIAAQYSPILFLGSFGGFIADRYSKRKILIISLSLACLLSFMQTIFVYYDIMTMWLLYWFAFTMGILTAFEHPANQSFIFEMVGKEHIKNAVSLNASMTNVARIIGPSLTALLVPTFGLAICFFINAISYVGVLVALFMIRGDLLRPVRHASEKKSGVITGIRYIASNPRLRYNILMIFVTGVFTFEFAVTLPLLAEFTFHDGRDGLAMLYAALGIGSVLGGLYAASRMKTSLHAVTNTGIGFGLAVLFAAFAPTLSIALLAMVPVGFLSINFLSLANSLLQIRTAPEMRGRVMSLWSISLLGSTPFGGPIIGAISQYVSPRWGLAVGGIAAIAISVWIILVRRQGQDVEISEENLIAHTNAVSNKSVSMK